MSDAADSTTLASTAEIRGHFPALERLHAGRPVAYFDGPGGTQVPRTVAEAMTDYLLHHNANTHWHYPSSIETDAAIAAAREAVADLLGSAADEVAFGANMTTLAFHVARGLAREWASGDEIVITELDHHANQAPWTAVAEERGLVVRQVPFDSGTGRLDLDALRACLGPRTRLVAVGAASNALGTVTDVAHVTRMAHAAGAVCFVDAVHAAPHVLLDVRAIGCDFLACSPYKFYGPHLGVLYGRRDRLAALRGPRRGRLFDFRGPAAGPHAAVPRFEPGLERASGPPGFAGGHSRRLRRGGRYFVPSRLHGYYSRIGHARRGRT